MIHQRPEPRPPAQVEPYVRVLGIDDTIVFLLTFGGAELYLPRTPKGRSRLAELFGVEKAAALAEAAEFMPKRVPLAKPWIAKVWHARGLSQAEIARRLHVSDVTVRRYLASDEPTPPDSDQLTLF
jgi:hypothetical protein